MRRCRWSCQRIDFFVAVAAAGATLIVNDAVDEIEKPVENDVERRAAQKLRSLNTVHPSADRQRRREDRRSKLRHREVCGERNLEDLIGEYIETWQAHATTLLHERSTPTGPPKGKAMATPLAEPTGRFQVQVENDAVAVANRERRACEGGGAAHSSGFHKATATQRADHERRGSETRR